jgi:hypothetical protein
MFNIKLWRYTKFAHNYSSHSVARCHYSACNRSTALVCASSPFNPDQTPYVEEPATPAASQLVSISLEKYPH